MDIKLKYRAWVGEKHADISSALINSDIETFAIEFAERVVKDCFIPAVSGSLPVSDEELSQYMTSRFSDSHLKPEIIAFRAVKYYQQGLLPVSGRRCCLDESEGKQ